MTNRVVHIFKNVMMAYQHSGLVALAKAKKVDLNSLDYGEHVLFINAAQTKLKLYSSGGVISYYRSPGDSRLNLNMVEFIPRCFNENGAMDWDKANKLALTKLLTGKITKTQSGEMVK